MTPLKSISDETNNKKKNAVNFSKVLRENQANSIRINNTGNKNNKGEKKTMAVRNKYNNVSKKRNFNTLISFQH